MGLASSLCLALLLAAIPAGAVDRAAAFLETGAGARAAGLGDAYSAAAEDPSAAFWNPAGLARVRRWQANAALQPMSLGRRQSSVSAALNVRGDLAFGGTWVHAGVEGLEGRTSSGARTGSMDDAENAVCVGVARTLNRGLAVGAAMLIVDQRLALPAGLGWPDATASGHGFGLGLQWRLGNRATLAAAARNLGGNLQWQVRRGSQQASTSVDPLGRVLAAGAAVQLTRQVLLCADLRDAGEAHGAVGVEWRTGDLLTVRAGAARVGAGAHATAGLTVRPMRTRALQFEYAYVSDPLDAGDRVVLGLGVAF